MVAPKDIWIKTGYETFAILGESGLKIEQLAQKVGVSKSSFYHYFADMEVFTEWLLRYHLEQAQVMADKESKAQSIDPELVAILVEHKTDLLFSRHLRFNRQNKQFDAVLKKSDALIGNELVGLLAKDMHLPLTKVQLEGLLALAMENFYLQINADNLNTAWLAAYFNEFKRIAKSFSP